MADFATLWDDTNFRGDWTIVDGDIATDMGLQTPVIIALMSDRVADADDTIPDAAPGRPVNRRGWWGDAPLPGESTDAAPDRIGSKLWLMSRALALPATAVQGQEYCQQSLQTLIDDGHAQEIDTSVTWITGQALGLVNVISRQRPGGLPVKSTFDVTWQATLGGSAAAQSAGPPGQVLRIVPMAFDDGTTLGFDDGTVLGVEAPAAS